MRKITLEKIFEEKNLTQTWGESFEFCKENEFRKKFFGIDIYIKTTDLYILVGGFSGGL